MQEIWGQFSPNNKQQQNAQLTGRKKKKKNRNKEHMENIIIITSEVVNFNMLSVRNTLQMWEQIKMEAEGYNPQILTRKKKKPAYQH